MSTSKRKRFSTGGASLQGISDAVSAGTVELGELNFDSLDIDRIEPDPENPRRLGLSEDELAWLKDRAAVAKARADESPDTRTETLLALRNLADSMDENGVLQPIKVYRHGTVFRIAYGERRYWAARVAGLSAMPAWILSKRPTRLRAVQLVENIQREDLILSARVRNVIGVLSELAEDGEATGQRLATLVGMNERTARRYLQVAQGPENVRDAVLAGELTALKDAAAMTGMDEEMRLFVLEAVRAGKSVADAVAVWEARQRTKETEGKRGRPKTKVTLGSTRNVALVKALMGRLLDEDQIPDVDWDDYGAIAKAWQQLLADIERSL